MDFIRFIQRETTNKSKQGKMKTAQNYQATQNTFFSFLNRHQKLYELSIEDVDSKMIKAFELYLINKGVCKNSISFYMRILRAIYNRGISKSGFANKRPFTDVYTGIAKTSKRAVDIHMVKKIIAFQPGNASMDFAKDAFLFCFYSCGMPFIDMAKLTARNISNGRIVYKRSKTEQVISIKLENEMKEIINKYISPNRKYIFPILEDGKEEHICYNKALRQYNLNLNKIGAAIGEGIRLSSYVPRHSWASIAHDQNVSMNTISESLGHSNEKTTSIYIKSLSTRNTDLANEKIIKKLGNNENRKKEENANCYQEIVFYKKFYAYKKKCKRKHFTFSV